MSSTSPEHRLQQPVGLWKGILDGWSALRLGACPASSEPHQIVEDNLYFGHFGGFDVSLCELEVTRDVESVSQFGKEDTMGDGVELFPGDEWF